MRTNEIGSGVRDTGADSAGETDWTSRGSSTGGAGWLVGAARNDPYSKDIHCVRWALGTTDVTESVATGVTVVEGNHGGANPPCAKR